MDRHLFKATGLVAGELLRLLLGFLLLILLPAALMTLTFVRYPWAFKAFVYGALGLGVAAVVGFLVSHTLFVARIMRDED